MKKASKAVLGGVIGLVGSGGAQAGVSAPFSLECPPSPQTLYVGNDQGGGCFEVSVRCAGPGTYGVYGFCVFGEAGGDPYGMYLDWEAWEISELVGTWGGCDEYGTYLGTSEVDTDLDKLESKITDALKGNGKPGSKGFKGGGNLVEGEMKRVDDAMCYGLGD